MMCFVIVGALVSANALFATSTNAQLSVPSSFSTNGTNLDISRTTPEFTSISMSNPHINVAEITENFETFHAFTVEGEPFLAEEGNPAVPRITRLFRIPNTGSVALVIENAEYELQSGINPFPYRQEDQPFQRDAKNLSIYQRDAFYPREIATISEPMIMRDFRIVEVTLYPVQVNPVTGVARIYHDIDVNIVANGEPGVNELLNPRAPSGRYASMYRDMIENLDEHALDDATLTPGSYLILAMDHASMNQWTDSLELWKKRKGFDVIVEKRVSWTAAQMNAFIQTTYDTSEPPLEFVCLMGDPFWTAGVPSDGDHYDHSFALTAGTDELEDIGVGRLSGSSGLNGDMHVILNKIFAYERDPYMVDTDWFTQAFLYAGTDFGVASNWLVMQWADQVLSMHTGVVNNTVDSHPLGVNETVVQQQLEAGRCMFLWRGAWIGDMSTGLAATINTGPRLPICLTVTCVTGDFQTGFAVSESYLVAGSPSSLKGGVSSIGMATISTHPAENNTVAGGLIYAIANLGIEHMGHCLSSGKTWLTKTFGAGSNAEHNFNRWGNLMGDPGLSIWTDIPVVQTVFHPASFSVGARQAEIRVQDESTAAIQDALVVLWKDSETYVKGLTDETGQVVLPITVNTAGDLLLTVTKRNHKPYLATIPCTNTSRYVSYLSLTFDDDNTGGTSGNNDGDMNPGETIDLDITIKNFGTSLTATGISATLASNNPLVQVINDNSTYSNLAPGASGSGLSNFRIQVDPTMQHDETVQLTLDVLASSVHTLSGFEFTCVSGDLQHVSETFIGGLPIPGSTRDLEVTIANNGDIDLNSITGILLTSDPVVTIVDNFGTFGDIDAGFQGVNAGDRFTIQAAPTAFYGRVVPMTLALETADGKRDTTYFSITLGSASSVDPSGPDEYGYIAYDNTDTGYDLAPTFNYVDISGIGTNLNLADIGEKRDINDIWSAVVTLPFSFDFYGVTYTRLTVCSNGWCAFGDQGWNDVFRNAPIPAHTAPQAMIAPYWDDLKTTGGGHGVWVYNDTANDRYIIQWKASAGSFYTSNELNFEIILLDEAAYPTQDGNGKILVQYADVAMNLPDGSGGSEPTGSTVGIQDHMGLDGLPYCFQIDYMTGAATISDGTAILYTTDDAGVLGLTFNLIDPNGGEVYVAGDPIDVIWSPGEVTGNVKIELSRSGAGGSWETVTASTANDGFHTFTAETPTSENCRVRITSLSFPDSTDLSQNDFRIAIQVTIFSEDFESGAAGWTHSAGGGWGDDWHLSTERAVSGVTSYKCGDAGTGDYNNSLDARLTSPVISSLPEGMLLEYEQWLHSELSTEYPDSSYDGGVLEISVNAGPFTQIFPVSNYTHTFRHESGGGNPYSGPMPGVQCFAGEITQWNTIQVDMSPYAGDDIQLRWRFGSDGGLTFEGWHVDDVMIFGLTSIPDPTIPVNVTIHYDGSDVILRWDDDANISYQIYSSDIPETPFGTLEGTTATNSFVIPGGAGLDKRFFYVVGWNG